jgi:small GTP-binding protein
MIGPSKSRPRSAQRRPSSSENGPSVGGARGIRNIRKNRDPEQENVTPSNQNQESNNKNVKKSARVDAARSYLADHVDPLMAEIINFLLSEQPEQADQAILSFLESRQCGEETKNDSHHNKNKKNKNKSDTSRNAVLRDRQYMARTVQPVLERLMKRVVEDQPLDVEAHFIQQLKLGPMSPALSSNIDKKKKSNLSSSNHEKDKQMNTSSQTPTPSAVNDVSLTTLTNRIACDALYRILNEKSLSNITIKDIKENIIKFHNIGFPLDFLALEFWLNVQIDMGLENESLDCNRFFKLMKSVASYRNSLNQNKKSLKLSSFLEKQAVSQVPVAAPSPSQPQPSSSTPSSFSSSTSKLEVGTAVTVNYKNSGNFYPGKIKTCRPDGNYDISYDDGDSEVKVPLDRIQVNGAPASAAPSSSSSSEQNEPLSAVSNSENSVCLSSRVEVNYKSTGKFYPGSVAVVNSNGTFNIGYDDGDSESNVPLERIKLLNPITGAIIPIPGSATDTTAITAAAAKKSVASMKPVIALVGISGAGKSTLLKAMSGDPDPKPRPTTGFSQKKLPFEVQGNEVNVHWYDLPGSWTSKWAGYLTECHGIVFVIDSSADDEMIASSKQAFNDVISNDAASGKPLLILANKQDLEGSKSCDELKISLLAGDSSSSEQTNMKFMNSIIHPERNNGEFDTNVEQGLEWLLDSVSNQYTELDKRVKEAEANAAIIAAQEKLERHRRVFTKLLAEKAFPKEGEPIETFSVVDSYEFLAMELLIHDPQVEAKTKTADEDWGLDEVAKQVVHLVGCQKMAMIMVADMINPENKKTKTTHTWDEVVKYVKDRREDAGLPRDI